MFVRFRRLPNGGFLPTGAPHSAFAEVPDESGQATWEGVQTWGNAAKILCRRDGGHEGCHRFHGGHCRLRPRCRYVIDVGGPHLELYRLKVELLANSRVNGKIKQEVVASLGSIDAVWLESFWTSAPEPEWRPVRWELWSLTHRTDFWQLVLDRMSKIGDNRLNKDERVSIRRAIHKVVPWVMELERKRLEVLEALREYQQCRFMHQSAERRVADDQETIERATKSLKENQDKSAELARAALQVGLEIAKLEQ